MATRELREHFKATRHSERLSATPGNLPSWARCSAAAGSSSPRTAAPDDAAKDDDDCIESAPVADSTQRAVTRGPAVEQLLGEGDLRSLGCFHRDGCAVLEQGILGSKRLSHDACIRECERLQREVMQRWWGDGPDAVDTIHLDHGTTGRRTPVAGTRALAATFLEMFRLGGEEALALVESPRVLELARRALGCEEVVIDRVSCGDPLTLHGDSASQGGMPAPEGWQRTDGYNDNVLARTGLYPSTAATRENQFIWHTDRSGHTQHEMPQVYFRSVLDPQLGSGAEGNNARLRLWPGSQHWSEERLDAQLQAMAQAEGGTRPDIATQDQPEQIVVDVTPQQTLMWTTAALHSTELQRGPGPRRYMEWVYAPLGRAPTHRDARAVKLWFPEWEAWPASRRRLWGLDPAAQNPPLVAASQLSVAAQPPVLPPSAVAPKAAL